MFVRLSEDESVTLIQRAKVARLGCIVDGGPYVVPINCYYADSCIYSHSLPGQKISALRENPKACLQFDEVESDLRWRSVLAFGTYEEIRTSVERSEILNRLLQRFPMLTPVESTIAEDAGYPQVIVYRIKIDRITGLSET
ncbi:MAG TPA: pyridoxamine 5'-phosphate oxidase family protein [Pyrinomonadaceae bacterium]|nr:pyridoxamine 5'-phosphate oxidase family protein [Pyrinomonadaceae bacterium]